MANNEFTIIIKKEVSEEDGKNSAVNPPLKKNKKKKDDTKNKNVKQILYFTKNEAETVAKQAIDTVLDVSGATSMQKGVNNFTKIASPVTSIAAGFAYGGVVGGILAAAGQTIKAGINEVKANIEITKQNQAIDYTYDVTGNTSLKGSRYTND